MSVYAVFYVKLQPIVIALWLFYLQPRLQDRLSFLVSNV